MGVFVRELLAGLAPRPEVDPSVFAVSWRGRDGLAAAVPPGVAVSSRPVPARLARPAWARSGFPSATWLGGPADVVHGPNHVVPPGGGAAELVTIHDLTAVRFPEMCTADVLRWPALLDRAVARGAWVHTDTEAVADEVRAGWPAVADRVVAIPLGVRRPPAAHDRSSAAVGRRLAGADRYVLAVGTVEPRKDLPSLVAAFDRLAGDDRDLRLVVAGPDGWGVDEFVAARDRARHRRRIVRLGWVDDDQRLALLRGATVVAYPSRYEGFGLVPLEALAVGTPVVATRLPAIEEITGDGARLVEPGDADALAEALAETWLDPAAAAERVRRGQARVDALTWDRTIDAMVDLYRRVADRS